MSESEKILDDTPIQQHIEFLSEIEFLYALAKESEKEPMLDTEQLDRLRLCTKLLANIQSHLPALEEGELKIRYNQLESLVKFIAFLGAAGEGNRLGYFQQPTGAGKTILMAIIAMLCSVKTLFLVPRNNLIEQTFDALKKIGFTDDDIGIVGDGKFQPDNKITICTYHSLRKLRKHNKMGYELTICDEAHRGLGDATSEHLQKVGGAPPDMDTDDVLLSDSEKYISQQALRLGFTATPDLKDKSVETYFEKLIHSITFSELVRSGILVKFRLVHTEGNVYNDDMDRSGVNQEMEVKILERENVYEKLIAKYIETTEKVGKLRTAVFCPTIAECDKFVLEAEKMGLKSVIVTSRESIKDRKVLHRAEDGLMNGELDFIVTVEKLGEGWDFPPLEAVILARATLSPVRIIQPIGRAARSYTSPDGIEKEVAYVFETEWERKNATWNGNGTSQTGPDSDSDANDTDNDELVVQGERVNRKPLNVAQALVKLGETDILEICEGIDGESLNYESYEKPPDGWSYAILLASALNVDPSTVQSLAKKLLVSNPDTFKAKFFLNNTNMPIVFYSPDLVAAIKSDIKGRDIDAPEGWMTELQIVKRMKVSRNFIVSVINPIVKKHPEWTRQCASTTKRKTLIAFYSPEVIALVQDAVNARPSMAPPGWVTRRKLSIDLKIDSPKIDEIAALFRGSHPLYICEYLTPSYHDREHFSPEFAIIINAVIAPESVVIEDYPVELQDDIRMAQARVKHYEVAPEGWMTKRQIKLYLNIKDGKFAAVVKRLTGISDDYKIVRYRDSDNNELFHYSPAFVAAIKAESQKKYSEAPDGWLTAKDLAVLLKVSEDTISKKLPAVISRFPDCVKIFRNNAGWDSDYYSPEICAALIEQFESRPDFAPPGWMTKAGLSVAIGITRPHIEKYSEPQRECHPEWFRKYRDSRNREYEHYSPELISFVKEKLGVTS